MDFITQDDLNLISACAGKEVDEINFTRLKTIYTKLEYLCLLLQKKGFKYSIRKDPRKQAGQGKFVFQEYQWAKIYPSEFYGRANDKFAYIIGFTDVVHFHLMGIKEFQHYDASQTASERCWTEISLIDSDYEKIVDQFIEFDKQFRKLFIETGAGLGIIEFIKIGEEMKKEEIKNLLWYKKQIILQGPPGTGKTKLAKEISREMIDSNLITEVKIREGLSVGLQINSATNYTDYTIKEFGDLSITLGIKNSSNEYKPSYKEIIAAFETKMWDGKQANGNDPYAAAIAKYLFENLPLDQVKIIQFHPSYSYEDFVRGIVAESKGDRIEYKNVNKILGQFAAAAKQNWDDNKKDISNISKENKAKEYFEEFVDELNEKITGGELIALTPNVNLIDVDDDAFRYKGNDGWSALGNRMLFKDIIRAFLDGNKLRQDIKKNKNLSGLAIQHASYFVRVLNMFQDYLGSHNLKFDNLSDKKVELKNYVLIIDEINRANLSSVLGELIYALEYRGENVESMYAVDGNNELVLPPNLYIIGTMNTADRSVGHIDYAIRRRFAFVDVQPKDLTPELADKFHKDLFEKVAALFNTNLSPEFEKKDVQLGHSYFINKSDEGGSIDIRLQYEIKPILFEYVKDGILIGENIKQTIEDLTA